MIAFPPIGTIVGGGMVQATMNVKEGSTPAEPLKFEIWTAADQYPVSLSLAGAGLGPL